MKSIDPELSPTPPFCYFTLSSFSFSSLSLSLVHSALPNASRLHKSTRASRLHKSITEHMRVACLHFLRPVSEYKCIQCLHVPPLQPREYLARVSKEGGGGEREREREQGEWWWWRRRSRQLSIQMTSLSLTLSLREKYVIPPPLHSD